MFGEVHPYLDGSGEDLLGRRELWNGLEAIQTERGVLRRSLNMEVERRPRVLCSRRQVQGGHQILLTDSEETH